MPVITAPAAAPVPAIFHDMLMLAHPSWRPVLRDGLEAIAATYPAYLGDLAADTFLPTENRLFAAFAQPLDSVRYVLMGEGPYPRPQSATGFCFMDGAVDALWAPGGLSKQVNRATSLRNFMKMLLVAAGRLRPGHTSGDAMAEVATMAAGPASPLIQTRAELQDRLVAHGFLLLNAALVYRPDVPPLKEARAWQAFQQCVLAALSGHARAQGRAAPTLILWGKVAEQLQAIPALKEFPQAASEHPYNLSFIHNPLMQSLFGPLHLLEKDAPAAAGM